jgi:hypothetical protein
MAQNTGELVVGATGAVYVAPVGTTLPTSIAAALDAAFIDLGLLTEDGVTVAPSVSQEVIRAWQRLTRVRTIITERDFEIEFEMMQWNEDTLPFAMGGGAIVVDVVGPPAEYSYDFPDDDVRDERAMVIEWQDGTKDYRLVIPRLEVTDLASLTVARTDTANLGVTLNVVSNPSDAYTMRLQSDDPAFAA